MSAPTTPDTWDLLYSEVDEDLRASVRALVERRSPWDAVLARTETGDTTDLAMWSALTAEIGCAGLPVGEERGGAGASWREVAVVAEELGRAVAPVPFLGSAVVATALLLEIGSPDVEGLLAGLAAGEAVAALAVPAATDAGSVVPTVEPSPDGDGLRGSVRGVLDAERADVLLVPVGDAVHLVDATAEGVERTRVVSLDMTRPLVDLDLRDVPSRVVAGSAVAPRALARALQVGAAVLAAEQLGLAERCLEMTVEYLLLRRQFGRVLGGYQALKHRLADLWVDVTQARAVARYAAGCAAIGSGDLPVATALAQAHGAEVAQRAAEECLQLHGGIGFTWEHPAHLLLKRAKSSAIVLGPPDRHRGALADLLDLPGAGR